MNIVQLPIAGLKPYKNNPRHNDDAVDKVAESIKQFGFKVPIIIGKDNVIIAGHTRLKAAKKLKLETVPCIRADDLTDEQAKAFRLADNKTSEFATWDFEKLENELLELKSLDFDMTEFGFDEIEQELEEEEIEEDEIPEVPEETNVKYGDIYILGRHILMCGDATKKEDVDKLMSGVKADMVFTDPPYGMKKESEGVLNDNLNFDDLLDFNRQWIPLTFGALKDNGSWYCWGIDEPLMDIYSNILKPMAKQNKITFRNLITWNKFHNQKPTAIKMMRSYCVYDEKCLFVMCGTQGFNNNQDNYFEEYEPIRKYLESEAQKAQIDARKLKEICGVGMFSHWFTKSQWDLMKEEHYKKIQQYCVDNSINAFGVEFGKIKKQYDEIKKQWYDTRAYFDNTHETYMTEVWDFETTSGEEREHTGGHATPKPIALCSRAIKSSSRENEIVLDVFGGSGSTLIACEQLNRKCYMMELDPHYIDVIIERWENFTGQKAKKTREKTRKREKKRDIQAI